MGDLDSVNALVERTVERFGQIDVIVNNAATSLAQPLGEFTSEAWSKVFDVDLRGPVFLVQAALPQLKASSAASVINMSSIGAFTFSAGVSMYAAAKAGLQAFTRSMAAAYAPFDIRVNALCPGSVDTDMTRSTGPESMARMAASCLQNRIADSDEMVGPALFLAGGASSYMTGQVLICDGGYLSH
jgi:NAD(P)-dependent dehydrogenase (short-subunit alcohol dehydrogenase family)